MLGFCSGNLVFVNLVILFGNDVDLIKMLMVNVGNVMILGVDIDVCYKMVLWGGKLDVMLNGIYVLKFDVIFLGGLVFYEIGIIIDVDGNLVINVNIGGVVLCWKYVLLGMWSSNGWSVMLI